MSDIKLSCELTIDDLMVGFEHSIDSNPLLAAAWRRQFWFSAGIGLTTGVVVSLLAQRWDWLAIGLLFVVVLAMRQPSSSRRACLLSGRRHFEATSQELLGQREYSIEERGLRVVTQITDETIFWPSICDVVQLPQHVLVVVGKLAVLVIAKERVTTGNAESFCRELISRWQAATATTATSIR